MEENLHEKLMCKKHFLNSIYTYKTKGKAIEAVERLYQWVNRYEDILFENGYKLMKQDFPKEKLTPVFIQQQK